MNKSDGKFDEKKFAAIVFEHMKRPALTSLETYAESVEALPRRARPRVRGPKHAARRASRGSASAPRTSSMPANDLDYYFREPPELDPKARDKFMTPETAANVVALADVLEPVATWEPAPLEAKFKEFLEQRGIGMKEVAQPTRVALTGRSNSPPLFDVMSVLGRERTLARLRRAARARRRFGLSDRSHVGTCFLRSRRRARRGDCPSALAPDRGQLVPRAPLLPADQGAPAAADPRGARPGRLPLLPRHLARGRRRVSGASETVR